MTREEYYAGIEAYKNKLEHRATDANAEDTAGKALESWKNQYLNQAINLRAKQYLASKSGRTDDASTYEKQLQILLDKMTNLKGVSLSAKQAILQTIDQTATNKANVQFAKHSDEPEDGVLEHGEWKKHKYIRIENGRYIYPEDLKNVSKSSNSASSIINPGKGILQKVGQAIGDKIAGSVLSNSNTSGAAINKAQADGAKRTADLQKSAYQKTQSAEEHKSDPNEAKEQSYDIDAKYNDYYAKLGRESVNFFGSRASNKTEAVEGYEESFARGKRMAEEGARDSAVSRAQASGMRRTNALKEGQAKNEEHQVNKESFAKETEDVAKANEQRKERAVNNNNQSVQTARSQSDESAAKAQKEGEAMQAWKNAQAVRAKDNNSKNQAQAEGEAQQRYKDKREAAAKAAKLSISAWASGETTDKPGKYANEVNELIKSLDLGGDEEFQKQYISEVVKIYDQERDKLPPNVRSIIDKELADLKDRDKPKKIGHSLNLTREEYYAGIEEYKRKKA